MSIQIDSISEDNVITLSGTDVVHTPLSLAPGAVNYLAVDALSGFPTFAVQFDTIVGVLADSGSSVVWENKLFAWQGRWWNVFALQNNANVDVNVIVKTRNL